MKPKTLRSNFMWAFLGNIVYAISLWAVIASITKFGTVEMVGQYSLALAITAPIFLFLQMNMRSIQATDKENEFSYDEFLMTRIILSSLGIFISLVASFIFSIDILLFIIIFIVTLAKFSESISDITYGLFQKKELMMYSSLSKVLRGTISVITLSIVLYFTGNFLIALISYAIVWMVILFIYDLPFSKKVNEQLSLLKGISFNSYWQVLKKLTIISLPLGIVATIDSLNVNTPRYLISFFLDEEKLGFFAAVSYLIIAGQTVITALAHASMPKLAGYWISNKESFRKLLNKLLFIGLVIGFIGCTTTYFFGEIILTLLYTELFSPYSFLLFIIMIAGSFWYLSGFLNAAIIAMKLYKIQIPIYLVSLIVTLISGFMLIPLYELNGAAISLGVGFLIRALLSYLIFEINIRKVDTKNIS